nr:glucose-1-phosphate adenylyltransferase large subunit 1-like [Tanacetum cinerariifolium]
MLNKENYVSWSYSLFRYAKSRPNGNLIHNFIINGPYVRRMVSEPSDPNREVPVNETFHVQIDDELTEKELEQIEADDQAIRTILLGLLEDIYAAVDSCETAQDWLLAIRPNSPFCRETNGQLAKINELLKWKYPSCNDFGSEIIPFAVAEHNVKVRLVYLPFSTTVYNLLWCRAKDYYQTDSEIAAMLASRRVLIVVGQNTKITNCIIDKNAKIGKNEAIAYKDNVEEADRLDEGFYTENTPEESNFQIHLSLILGRIIERVLTTRS